MGEKYRLGCKENELVQRGHRSRKSLAVGNETRGGERSGGNLI